MNDYPSNVKEKLNFIISDMANHHWLFANRPGHDFMRQNHGKLSFYDTMRLIIGMGKGNTNDEIMDYFDLDPDRIPYQSAFNQRRSQISLSTLEYLFSEFSSAFPATTNTFKDHCILACDGCHVVYTTNSEIIEDFNKPHLIDYKGYNHMHLNLLYNRVKSLMNVRLSTSCLITFSLMSQVNISLLLIEDTNLTNCFIFSSITLNCTHTF